ncbi:MAG: FKBP-type peptidyl-prolyl cis-trans isomerase [Bacteroidetes bacterium]|nr:FKBP-type peptidyl-prolyl cis-trans isomerase [Bacteroidota bacterium]
MKIKLIALMACVAILFTACGDFKKTKSGAMYKVQTSKGGKKPKMGDVVQIHFMLKTSKDSIFQSSYKVVPGMSKGKPQYVPVKEGFMYRGLVEAFMEFGEGDSGTIKFIGDSLFSNPQSRPPFIKPKDVVKMSIKVIKVLSEEEYRKVAAAESQKMQQEQIAKDEEVIQNYLKYNKLKAEKTASGLYYVIEKEGKGELAKAGDSLSVFYSGKLTSGEVFDANMGKEAKGKDPLPVVIGKTSLIQGWTEGLTHFKNGGKGKLIVPSSLGYGPRGDGPIPPNSVLVFDIEVAHLTPYKK